jgi:hypothetical protein
MQLQPSVPGLPFTAMLLLDSAAAAGLLAPSAGAAQLHVGSLQPAWLAAAVLIASEAAHAARDSAATATRTHGGVTGSGLDAAAGGKLPDADVAAQFEVSTEALRAAAVTLRGTVRGACEAPVTPYMLLELYTQALSVGRMDYQVSSQRRRC